MPDGDVALPVLAPELDEVLGEGPAGGEDAGGDEGHAVAVTGSGPLWPTGPLDVDRLAVLSVVRAAQAASRLAAVRGRPVELTVDRDAVAAVFDSFGHLRVDGRRTAGWAPLSGFFETADGWVRLHGNYPHHAAAIAAVTGATEPDDVRSVLAHQRSADVELAVRRAGGCAAAVRTAAQWRALPQHEAPRGRSLVDLALEGGTRALPCPTGALPMSGLRVLDLTRVIAGPTATRLLGALGADVLRVDPPGMPELTHQHVDTGFAKRSALADLADPDALDRLHALLADADVLVSGYRPGALRRFGLGADQLRERHPALVVVELSAWGHDGPWTGQRGFDSVVQAATGIATAYGTTSPTGEWRPGALPVQALDHATGYLAAAAAMALLARRPVAGAGSARLALARTADWLLAAPRPATPVEPAVTPGPADVAAPALRSRDSDYGRLDYVPPPLTLDGVPLDYPAAPRRYGGDSLGWVNLPRR